MMLSSITSRAREKRLSLCQRQSLLLQSVVAHDESTIDRGMADLIRSQLVGRAWVILRVCTIPSIVAPRKSCHDLKGETSCPIIIQARVVIELPENGKSCVLLGM